MRKSANFVIPASLITAYYIFWVVVTAIVLERFPPMRELMPVGGIVNDERGTKKQLSLHRSAFIVHRSIARRP